MGKVAQRQGQHRTAFHVASVQVPWLDYTWGGYNSAIRVGFFTNIRGDLAKRTWLEFYEVWACLGCQHSQKFACQRWWILRPCLVRHTNARDRMRPNSGVEGLWFFGPTCPFIQNLFFHFFRNFHWVYCWVGSWCPICGNNVTIVEASLGWCTSSFGPCGT